MSLLLNMLFRFVIAFLPRSKCILISQLQSPSTMILEPEKIKFASASNFSLLFVMKKWDQGLPWWLRRKESTCNAGDAGDVGSVPRSGRSPERSHSNPLQYSCLENPTDWEAWWAAVHWGQRVGHDWSDRTTHTRWDAMILVFCMLSFKPAFSLSSFTSIKRLFSSSWRLAIRMVIFWISEVVGINPSYLNSSLWFIQPSISHGVLCISVKQ